MFLFFCVCVIGREDRERDREREREIFENEEKKDCGSIVKVVIVWDLNSCSVFAVHGGGGPILQIATLLYLVSVSLVKTIITVVILNGNC